MQNIPKSVSVKWLTRSGLSQIYSRGMEMCFISRMWEQCCQFVLCKDFLHDAVFSYRHKKPIEIYGFRYNHKRNKPIDLRNIRIAICNSQDPKFKYKIQPMISFLNQIEKEMGLKKSNIIRVKNPPELYRKCGVYIVLGSGRWLISPPMISLFALLIRCGTRHEINEEWRSTVDYIIDDLSFGYGESCSDDGDYLMEAMSTIEQIIKIGYNEIFYKTPKKNYPLNVDAEVFHDDYGICGFAMGDCEVKHWYKKLKY